MTLFIVSYDIPSDDEGDKRRSSLFKYLSAIGLRVQNSVFELRIPSNRIIIIIKEIEEIIDKAQDSVRIYRICKECAQQSIKIGKSSNCEYADVIFF